MHLKGISAVAKSANEPFFCAGLSLHDGYHMIFLLFLVLPTFGSTWETSKAQSPERGT